MTIFFVVLGISRGAGIYFSRIIKPYLYIIISGIGTIVAISILIGLDYTSLSNDDSEAGLILAIVMYAMFYAVSYIHTCMISPTLLKTPQNMVETPKRCRYCVSSVSSRIYVV